VRADGPAPATPGREAPPRQDHRQGPGACIDIGWDGRHLPILI
jgi:hypothetical protein